jgi:hypothetical protein
MARIRIDGELSAKIEIPVGVFDDAVQKAGVYREFYRGIIDLRDELVARSYVGATGELKLSWVVTEPRKPVGRDGVTATILNQSQRAINRIAGRGPGKRPPEDPIRRWVLFKGISTNAIWPIRVKIGKQGTRRFRTGVNFAGITPQGIVRPDSPIAITEKTLADRIRRKF